MIDSHCHLDFYPEAEQQAVIANAATNGVRGMLTIGLRIDKWHTALKLAREHPNIWASVGVHPLEAADFSGEEVAQALHSKAKEAVALGECGLDYFKDGFPPPKTQREVFSAHLDVAQTSGLPLIIHNRNADEETMKMLTQANQSKPITAVLHCFCSELDIANAAVAQGFYLGFGGIITYKNATAVAEVARRIPLEHILLETDAPFLAPTPLRGKRNEPSFIKHTAEFLANLKGITLEEVITTTNANFHRLFPKTKKKIA